jgi:AraC family transcriptional regulator
MNPPMGSFEIPAAMDRNPAPFGVADTHRIALWDGNHLHAHSEGLGWRDIYASFATESSWTGTLPAVSHLCLAYCLHRPAHITRRADGRTVQALLKPRLFGMVPADQPSDWNLQGTPDILLLYLRRSMVEQVAEEVFDTDPARLEVLPRLGTPDPLLEQLALATLAAVRGGEPGLYADSLARSMAVQLLRGHANSLARPAPALRAEPVPGGLQRVRDHIEAHLDAPLSVSDLAREAGIAEHAFARAFRRAYGCAPHQYVLQRRLERAKALLRRTDAPIVDIALQCGFSSQSHLAASFRQTAGVTPRDYRRGGAVG